MSDKIPVYIINGFLESGKTRFIKFTVSQSYFAIKGRTLIISCEEGVEEYDVKTLDRLRCDLEFIENEEDFTLDKLKELIGKHRPDRIIIEYNGTWSMNNIKLPDYTELEQQITIIDGTTFDNYFANMKSMFLEICRNSELVLVNRCDGVSDYSASRRALKAMAAGGEVVFEDNNGEEVDFSAEDLPYDFNAPVIEIGDDQYDIWFFDALEHRERYEGKVVRFKAQVFKGSRLAKRTFVPGRKAMVCCADDISFLGFVCKYKLADGLTNKQWVMVEATVGYAFQAEFRGVGPILTAISVTEAMPAAKEVLGA